MIRFLIKGLLRDRQRSRFPLIIVCLGVFLTVLMYCWLTGVIGDMIDFNAKFSTGHVKIMTRSYAENSDQRPNDLALMGVQAMLDSLREQYPHMQWVQRIQFGGLIDVPDSQGETRSQGPAFGMAVDLISPQSREIDRLNIRPAIIKGRLPQMKFELLLSDMLAHKLDIAPGEQLTILSSTMFGSMAIQNFTLAGTVQFGVAAMDRGAAIIDITAAQDMLDMQGAAGEVLGYFSDGKYDDERAVMLAKSFRNAQPNPNDEFSAVMLSLREQNDLASLMQYMESVRAAAFFIFILAMSLVLWNAGLLGGLRRYSEIGIRLALGEHKSHVFNAMVIESVIIGFLGWLAGTLIGLSVAYILQEKGIDLSDQMQNTSMMFPTVFRANITRDAWFVGLIPGLISTVLGTALSGFGIYKRQTAQLFKEMEA